MNPEGHAGGHEQEQRLLLRQLLPQPLDGLAALVGSLQAEGAVTLPSRARPRFPDARPLEAGNTARRGGTAQHRAAGGRCWPLLATGRRPGTGCCVCPPVLLEGLSSPPQEGRGENFPNLPSSDFVISGQQAGGCCDPGPFPTPGLPHISASGPRGVFGRVPVEGQMHPQDQSGKPCLPCALHLPPEAPPSWGADHAARHWQAQCGRAQRWQHTGRRSPRNTALEAAGPLDRRSLVLSLSPRAFLDLLCFWCSRLQVGGHEEDPCPAVPALAACPWAEASLLGTHLISTTAWHLLWPRWNPHARGSSSLFPRLLTPSRNNRGCAWGSPGQLEGLPPPLGTISLVR